MNYRIARVGLHHFEEPCLSGERGSGTIFFSGCNLRCLFCQNFEISHGGKGLEVSEDELVYAMQYLQDLGAHNINLVTPSHFVPGIVSAIRLSKERGFDLPFVCNSSAYESVETLKMLDGLIDIYLPDFKYTDTTMAANYSHAKDYPVVAKAAIAEMMRQVPFPFFDAEKAGTEEEPKEEYRIMKKGVIIRHLVLPLGVKNSLAVIDYLNETYGPSVYISVMSQYTPLYDVPGALTEAQRKRLSAFPALHRKVTKREYEKVLSHCMELGLENVFIQEGDVAKESFIPPF
jgi:putative pyruvate formate lyase activating enzyme